MGWDDLAVKRIIKPVGECVYCGIPDGEADDFTTEHVCPKAIGGRWEHEGAVCAECQKGWFHIERPTIQTMLGDVRSQLDQKGHRRGGKGVRQEKPTHVNISVDNGEHLSIKDAKGMGVPPNLMLPVYDLPNICRGLPVSAPSNVVSYSHAFLSSEYQDFRASRLGLGSMQFKSRLSPDMFQTFLMRLAHSYAVAKLGKGAFLPFRAWSHPDLRNHPSYLVGGLIKPEFADEGLHTFGISSSRIGGRKFTTVRARLYASHASPTYLVIVGEAIS